MTHVKDKDYFADPQFKAMMNFQGFILTPPDIHFLLGKAATATSLMKE